MGAYFAQTFDQIMSKMTKYMSKKSRNVIFQKKKAPAGGRTTDKGFFPEKKVPAGGRTTDAGFFFIYIYIYIYTMVYI